MNGNYKVVLTVSQNNNFRESIGISPERSKQLYTIISNIWNENPKYKISEVIHKASFYCESTNELVFIAFKLGQHVGVHDTASSIMDALESSAEKFLNLFTGQVEDLGHSPYPVDPTLN